MTAVAPHDELNGHVTVVIPTLNGASTLLAQLEALDRQVAAPEFSVVVVDNDSEDRTAEVAHAFDTSSFALRIVHEPRRGINHARNAGVRAAAAGAVLLCDADDVVDQNWVAAMVRALEADRWVAGALDYSQLNSEATRNAWGAPLRSTFTESEPYVDNTYGCNCGFWTSMWAAVGGFDPSLSGIGGDENEFFMRAHAAGFSAVAAPEAIVSYRLRPGWRAVTRQRFRQGRSQVLLRTTPGGALMPPAPTTVESARALVRLALVSPRYVLRSSERVRWLATCGLHAGRIEGQRKVRQITASGLRSPDGAR